VWRRRPTGHECRATSPWNRIVIILSRIYVWLCKVRKVQIYNSFWWTQRKIWVCFFYFLIWLRSRMTCSLLFSISILFIHIIIIYMILYTPNTLLFITQPYIIESPLLRDFYFFLSLLWSIDIIIVVGVFIIILYTKTK